MTTDTIASPHYQRLMSSLAPFQLVSATGDMAQAMIGDAEPGTVETLNHLDFETTAIHGAIGGQAWYVEAALPRIGIDRLLRYLSFGRSGRSPNMALFEDWRAECFLQDSGVISQLKRMAKPRGRRAFSICDYGGIGVQVGVNPDGAYQWHNTRAPYNFLKAVQLSSGDGIDAIACLTGFQCGPDQSIDENGDTCEWVGSGWAVEDPFVLSGINRSAAPHRNDRRHSR